MRSLYPLLFTDSVPSDAIPALQLQRPPMSTGTLWPAQFRNTVSQEQSSPVTGVHKEWAAVPQHSDLRHGHFIKSLTLWMRLAKRKRCKLSLCHTKIEEIQQERSFCLGFLMNSCLLSKLQPDKLFCNLSPLVSLSCLKTLRRCPVASRGTSEGLC